MREQAKRLRAFERSVSGFVFAERQGQGERHLDSVARMRAGG